MDPKRSDANIHICLASQTAEEGELVVVLFGSIVPFLLRQLDTSSTQKNKVYELADELW